MAAWCKSTWLISILYCLHMMMIQNGSKIIPLSRSNSSMHARLEYCQLTMIADLLWSRTWSNMLKLTSQITINLPWEGSAVSFLAVPLVKLQKKKSNNASPFPVYSLVFPKKVASNSPTAICEAGKLWANTCSHAMSRLQFSATTFQPSSVNRW